METVIVRSGKTENCVNWVSWFRPAITARGKWRLEQKFKSPLATEALSPNNKRNNRKGKCSLLWAVERDILVLVSSVCLRQSDGSKFPMKGAVVQLSFCDHWIIQDSPAKGFSP